MENWVTVYDIRDTLPWVEICIMFIAVLLAVGGPVTVLKLSRSKIPLMLALDQTPTPKWVFRFFAWNFAVGGSLMSFCFSFLLCQSLFLRSESASAKANVAVGTIGPVEPIHKKGNTVMSERFVVGELQFVIQSHRLGTGLTQLEAEGGPCQSGRQVRITYTDDAILRVETINE